MWIKKCVFCFFLQFIQLIFCTNLRPKFQPRQDYGIQFEPSEDYLIYDDNRIELSDLFSPDYWFPIEINVPDTIMGAWQGIGSAWTAASDFFAMGNNEQTP